MTSKQRIEGILELAKGLTRKELEGLVWVLMTMWSEIDRGTHE